MGTPEFAVASLDKLVDEGYQVLAVVTSPDKAAGRGQKLRFSAVKEYALQHQLPILQPVNLKDENFIAELKALNANLYIVVAFRMLPEAVWGLPEYGTFNLHASLLPDYRGAAPINRVLINGEKYTGVTTFFINEQIDTGAIIFREKVDIDEDENASMLHDKLMEKGAGLVIRTVKAIIDGSWKGTSQQEFLSDYEKLHPAPKIQKEDCRIQWNKSTDEVYNFIRGLSEYPGAFTELKDPDGLSYYFKILGAKKETGNNTYKDSGRIVTDQRHFLKISTIDGFIDITELQLSGKKKMEISSFLRGFKIDENWSVYYV